MLGQIQEHSDIHRRLDRVSRDLHAAQLRIDNLTRWHQPAPDSIDAKVLAALEVKRDRLALEIIDMRATLPPQPSRLDTPPAGHIAFKKGEWHPAGSIKPDIVTPDIPACLKRSVRP
jgi:hypothetical protein